MPAATSDATSSTTRDARIAAAVERWTGQLIDLSRRNNLLFFKDLKTGTLDLADAEADYKARLLTGQPVRASQLYTTPEAFQSARRRLTEVKRKMRLLSEERGIDAGFVAVGMLSWQAPQSGRAVAVTRSPILLRPLTIRSKGLNAADFELLLEDSAELNPVLSYALNRQVGVNTAGVAESIAKIDIRQQLAEAVKLIQQRADDAGVATTFESKLVAAVFAYEKLPMVRDLEESTRLLANHPITAALAGDPEARAELQRRPEPSTPNLNMIRPESEHLVIDADPSQQAAIVAVLAGSDLILQGPPGTGKSQTIANLIAEAAAGKKVLFVAQKRAAIDAVVNNLKRRDLAELVLDLHDPKTSRKAVVEQIKTSMERASQEPPPDVAEVNRLLVNRRERSLRHSRVMTEARQPCGLSIAEMQQMLLALPPGRDLDVVLPTDVLNQLPHERIRTLADDIMDFVEADGLRLWRGRSPWSKARSITGEEPLRATRAQLDDLTGEGLGNARRALEELLRTTGLPRPATLGQWSDVIGLMTGVGKTVAAYGPEVFGPELADKRAAAATSAWRKQAGISIGFWRRRALCKAAKAERKEPARRETVFAELSAAVDQRDLWARQTGGHAPTLSAGADELAERYERLRDDLAAIGATTVIGDLADCAEPEMDDTLRNLKDDERMLVMLPKLNGQRAQYEQLGLVMLLNRLAAEDRTPTEAAEALQFTWLSSWLGEMRLAVPDYAGFRASTQDRLIDEFCEADTRHVELAAARVRRAVAERQMRARDDWPDQRQTVREQVGRKARHKPIRQLVDEAPDLLLAVRPCWAMSPLVVSQVLPARRLFDLVVFDEASQIEPADAIPAIMRGNRVVVAGDNKQLPPTPFFSTAGGDDDEEIEAEGALGDFESVLDVLGGYIPTKTLLWHYRSQDERLIAFSNREIYDDDLVTFPGTTRESSLRHLLVNAPSAPGARGYAPAEVDRVVELVVEHAEQRPDESLGVIALGRSGADLINARLRAALVERPDLATFFDEEAEVGRRFFVKNLENVQGDERDTIILSVGGSRTATGALNHNFGPINQKGGERRLNVAVTRARKALAVVSTFTHHDFIEERLNSRGLRFLRDYLCYASQQGSPTRPEPSGSDVSPIEQRIIDRLRNAGVPAHPRYGVSGSRIDIAAEHPDKAGQLLLAIEIDSHRYHEPDRSVRERDRLRPQQLERMGWRHQRVWTAEWFRDPESEITKLINALDSAKRGSDLVDSVDGDRPAPHHSDQAAKPDAPVERKLPRPRGLVQGVPIHEHPRYVLVDVARWIDSDGLLRDEEETIELMMAELGYKRRGKNIVDGLKAAIRAARAGNGR